MCCWVRNTWKCFHTAQISRKLLEDDTSDSDLHLSDGKCSFYKENVFMTKTMYSLAVKVLMKKTGKDLVFRSKIFLPNVLFNAAKNVSFF